MNYAIIGFICCITLTMSGCTSIGYKLGIAKCAPVYGNWCGENYPLSGYNPEPVDAWDVACREHDRCYESNTLTSVCDQRLVSSFRELSYRNLAPQRIHNAYDWFQRDGYVGGWVKFTDECWGLFADCKGGDGRMAEFKCFVNANLICNLDPASRPGRAGMICECQGYSGLIVE